jgi:thiamine biosynthesis lipoprotein
VAAELRFRAMGTHVHLLVVGAPAGALDRARARVLDLERRWSRFLPHSELSRLNRRAPGAERVSAETLGLVGRAIEGWRATGGAFDPTVHDAVIAAGYDRDIGDVRRRRGHIPASPPAAASGCEGIALDRECSTVALPSGLRLDAGGIGKGLAADLVSGELIAAGARGALVNVGGDLRVRGDAGVDHGWLVAVEDPFDRLPEVARIALDDAALATSTRCRRAWTTAGRPAHHLIDPATGAPAWTGLAQVSVVAAEGWRAEVLAKAAFVRGRAAGPAVLTGAGATGLLIADDGARIDAPGMDGVLA